MITFRLRDVPADAPYGSTVTIGGDSYQPTFFIQDFVKRWLAIDPTLPRIVYVTGLGDEPIECDVDKLPVHAYLFAEKV